MGLNDIIKLNEKQIASINNRAFDIVSASEMGVWSIETGNGEPKLYVDEITADLIGIDRNASPEEMYKFWLSHMRKSTGIGVKEFVDKMLKGERVKMLYFYSHPLMGVREILCGGILNSDYTGEGVSFKGYYHDITEYKKYAEEQVKHTQTVVQVNNVLAQDYSNIYLINPSNGIVDRIKEAEYKIDNIKNACSESFTYNEAWEKFVSKVVHPADRLEMYAIGKLETVINKLKAAGNYKYNFRTLYRGNLHYYQIHFVKIDDGSIILGFRNTDIAVLEAKKNDAIFEILSRDFSNIFIIDPIMRTAKIQKMNGYMISGFNKFGEVYPYEAILEKYIEDRVHPDDKKMVRRRLDLDAVIKAVSENPEYITNYRILVNGETHFYQGKMHVLENGEIISGFRSIDDAARQEADYRKHLEWYNNVLKYCTKDFSNIYLLNLKDQTIDVVSQAGGAVAVPTKEVGEKVDLSLYGELWAHFCTSIVSHEQRSSMLAFGCIKHILSELSEKNETSILFNSIRTGASIPFRMKWEKISENEVLMTVQNVSEVLEEEAKQQKKLADALYRAEHDPLTGVYNRCVLNRMKVDSAESGEKICLMIADVDNFKEINDTYGHEVGDKILKKVARLLCKYSRESDKVIRYGGDEFMLVMKGMTSEQKKVLAEKIAGIEKELAITSDGVPATSISVGIAFSENGYSQRLFDRADEALYAEKEEGRNGFKVFEAISE